MNDNSLHKGRIVHFRKAPGPSLLGNYGVSGWTLTKFAVKRGHITKNPPSSGFSAFLRTCPVMFLEPPRGFEPRTCRLRIGCTTPVLRWPEKYFYGIKRGCVSSLSVAPGRQTSRVPPHSRCSVQHIINLFKNAFKMTSMCRGSACRAQSVAGAVRHQCGGFQVILIAMWNYYGYELMQPEHG